MLYEYEIHLRNVNGPVAELEYYDAAWDCVVEDKLVGSSQKCAVDKQCKR